MKTESEKSPLGWFWFGLMIAALVINGFFIGIENSIATSKQRQQQQAQQAQAQQEQAQLQQQQKRQQQQEERQQQRKIDEDNRAAAQQAAQVAALEHANFLARYLNPGFTRKPNIGNVAVVVATQNGTLNNPLGSALALHFKTSTVQTSPQYFKPTFVSDKLFDAVFNGSVEVFNKLDLANSIDAVVLARDTVEYTTNPALNNVLTATMQLEVTIFPITGGQQQSWTFVAHGPGFSQPDARAAAEERIIKQITTKTNMTFIR